MSVKESIAQIALALAVGNTSLTEFFNPSKGFKDPTGGYSHTKRGKRYF